MALCSFPECVKPHQAKGYCAGHYKRNRLGNPLTPLGPSRAHRRVEGGLLSQCSPSLPVSEFTRNKATSSGYRSTCKSCDANRRRLSKYGVTPDTDRCELCGSQGRLVIDHDHSCCPGEYTCGKCIRGILCNGCNTAIGKLGDSIAGLQRAIEYLKKTSIGEITNGDQ